MPYKHTPTHILYNREREADLKNAVVNVYTDGRGTCEWCGQGDQDVLTLDHINNDGAKHRREAGLQRSGNSLYRWVVKHDYPTIFQVLCASCNLKKEVLRRREEADHRYASS